MRLEYWKSMAKTRLETIEFLAAENRRLRRQLWGVTIAALVCIVGLLIALWSAYHVSA
jgi:hypothetical protein